MLSLQAGRDFVLRKLIISHKMYSMIKQKLKIGTEQRLLLFLISQEKMGNNDRKEA